jgi:hypothetical protein
VDFQFNDANALAWRKSTFAEGVEVKDLSTSGGRSMQRVKFAAGASFPLRRHPGPDSSTFSKARPFRKASR